MSASISSTRLSALSSVSPVSSSTRVMRARSVCRCTPSARAAVSHEPLWCKNASSDGSRSASRAVAPRSRLPAPARPASRYGTGPPRPRRPRPGSGRRTSRRCAEPVAPRPPPARPPARAVARSICGSEPLTPMTTLPIPDSSVARSRSSTSAERPGRRAAPPHRRPPGHDVGSCRRLQPVGHDLEQPCTAPARRDDRQHHRVGGREAEVVQVARERGRLLVRVQHQVQQRAAQGVVRRDQLRRPVQLQGDESGGLVQQQPLGR